MDKLGQAIKDFGNSWGEWSNAFSGTEAQMQFSANEAKKQRAWEEMMSNSAYQRAVADMEAAGLNPAMLYASGGNGASTPSGASGSSSSGRSMDILSSIGNLLNAINTGRQIDFYSKKDEMDDNKTRKVYQYALDVISSRT